ncbi:hypothetical protein ACFYY1_29670 [Streptomyces sp. NPDC001890]|uniref:hypothetical protein n=1 Tax=Streptomyces sp. NPDC001890 TaxID=3364620 RepID=UPI0036BD9F89
MNHRSGMRPRAYGAVVGMSLSLALIAGCGRADGTAGDGTASAPARAADDAVKGPAYKGPALPGFAARPAWSLPAGDAAPGVLDLGSTLLLVKDAQGDYESSGGLTEGVLHSSEEADPLTLEFRDGKTGAVTRSASRPTARCCTG